MSNLWITPEELSGYVETEFAYEAAKAASNILWALSGRKYTGVTTVTERYVCVNRLYRYGSSIRNNSPQLLYGEVYNIPTRDLDFFNDITSDATSPSRRVRLRGRPVQKVHLIRNRVGTVINPSHYYLVDHAVIQAVPGVAWIPCDIEVTYTYGIEPPTAGKMAARTLAMEFAKLWNGDDDCALPQRVTSISRQGLSYTLLDSQDFIEEMRTGLYAVDLFLKSVNPDKARAKAKVFSPDVARARRYTPKPPKLAASDMDIAVPTSGTGLVDVSLEYLNAQFLVDEAGWTPYIIIRNYGESKSEQISAAVVVEDPTPSALTVTNKEIDDNIAILTTSADHGIYPGTEIVVSGVDATFNGTYAVIGTPTSTTVKYAKTAANVASTASGGTITAAGDDRLTISLTYSEVYQVLGMQDPGTYDLYAESENEDTVYIGSGNLKIQLASSTISAYTLG